MRIYELDFFRGIAVALMIVYHFCYDLSHFGYYAFDFEGNFFFIFRVVIVFLFLSVVGAGIYLTHKNSFYISKALKRLIKLLLASTIITISTMFIFPYSWIYFGIIHFIAISSFLCIPFVKIPNASLLIALAIIAISTFDIYNWNWLYDILKPFLNLPSGTQDLYPLTPWISFVLIGIFIMKHNLFYIKVPQYNAFKPIIFLGKNALAVYLTHQIVLFGIFYIISMRA